MKTIFFPFLAALFLISSAEAAASQTAKSARFLKQVLALPKASLLVEQDHRSLLALQPDLGRIPASTMKILTALVALRHWGPEHRFSTRFYRDAKGWLWVRGGGDPYLISEELTRIARALKGRGLAEIQGIGLDDSLFSPKLRIPGRGNSTNPYDAPITALAANFNTVSLINRKGHMRSAEPQTPLTPIARERGKKLGAGKHRVNLRDRTTALRYFGELFLAKLREQGIAAKQRIRLGFVPVDAKPLYRHENHRDLRAVVQAMLAYSSNFIANDLFLLLSDPSGQARGLNTKTAQRRMEAWFAKELGWRGHRIEDGAGLSRGNRLSARQLVSALQAFAPYLDLLPRQNDQIRAKTGTLRGVSCYAGFVRRKHRWVPFALLINQPVAYSLRLRVAEALATLPNLSAYCPASGC